LQTAALNGKLTEALNKTKRHIEMEGVREQARETLLKGLQDGSLAKAFQDTEQQEVPEVSKLEALRSKVRGVFATAAQNGALESVLGKKECVPSPMLAEKARQEIKDVLCKAVANGKLESVLNSISSGASEKSAEAATEKMRLMMKTTLSNAVLSGRLEETVAQIKRSQQDRAEAASPKKPEVESLRLAMRNALIVGAQTGALDKAVVEVKADELRVKARDVLRDACLNGSLEKVVQEVKEERQAMHKKSQIEALRKAMQMKISKAAEDGSLERAIKKTKDAAAVEDLRQKAKDVLTATAMNGRLKEALQQAVDAKKTDDLRLQAREALTKSALNGTLETILREEFAATEKQKTMASVRNALVEAAGNGSLVKAVRSVMNDKMADQEAELKRKAREELVQAAMNGKLSAALKETAAEERSNSLASKLFSGFQKGVQDGSLEATLQEVLTPQPKLEDKLKNAFSRAVVGGSLEPALRAAMTETTEELREKAKKCFLDAEKNGQLAAVVKQVMSSRSDSARRPREIEKYPQAPALQEVAPKPVGEILANPSKPIVAKGNARPSRHFPRAAQRAKPTPVQTEEMEDISCPYVREQRPSSCRSSRNRIIIGGVERGIANDDLGEDTGFRSSGILGRRSMVSAFRMDVEEASMMGGCDDAVDTHPWENPEMVQRRVAPGSKMHSSPPKKVMSAMAMDLGEEAPLPSSKSTLSARSPRASQSLGAVRPKIDMQAYSKLPPVFKTHKTGFPPTTMKRTRTPVSRKWATEKSTWTVQLGETAVQWDI
jgi:hypothetical protein